MQIKISVTIAINLFEDLLSVTIDVINSLSKKFKLLIFNIILKKTFNLDILYHFKSMNIKIMNYL